MPQVDDVIAGYLRLRAEKEALAKKHAGELAPVVERMVKLEGWLQKQLLEQGLQNFKGKSGVAFLQTATSVTVEDRNAMLNWIRENEAWDFLESRVSKSVVQDYMESTQEVPPGVSVKTETVVRVRQS